MIEHTGRSSLGRAAVVSAVLAALAVGLSAPAFAADPHADPFCPEAVGKTNAFIAAAKGNDPSEVAVAAHAVYDTYMSCAASAKLANAVEPAVNYDETRAAQYAFAEGRAFAAAGRKDEAVKALQISRKLSDSVVRWLPVPYAEHTSNIRGQSWTESNPDRRPSVYAPNAKDVRDAADAMLAKLGVAAPVASPAPKTS
jgi:hypothetical protein